MAQFPNTTTADGIWNLKKVRRAILGENWPPPAPTAPTTVTAVAGDAEATISFSGQVTYGDSPTFTVTSSPGGITATGSSPVTVTGLTNDTEYTFTVTVTDIGGSATSNSSNAVTPVATPTTLDLQPLFSTWNGLSSGQTSTLNSNGLYESDLTGVSGTAFRSSFVVVNSTNTTIDLNGSQLNYLNCGPASGGGATGVYAIQGFSAVNSSGFVFGDGYMKVTGSANFLFETSYNSGYGSATGTLQNLTIDITNATLTSSIFYSNGGTITCNNVNIIYDSTSNYNNRELFVNQGTFTGYTLVQKDTTQGQNLLASFPF